MVGSSGPVRVGVGKEGLRNFSTGSRVGQRGPISSSFVKVNSCLTCRLTPSVMNGGGGRKRRDPDEVGEDGTVVIPGLEDRPSRRTTSKGEREGS